MNRRAFLSSSAAAFAVASTSSLSAALQQTPVPKKRRYALVGTGGRGSGMWGRGVAQKWGDTVEFVGLCDPNEARAKVVQGIIGTSCPTFTDFDRMVKEAKPDLLAVTTVDAYHADYIVRALDLGIDVISEKPMTVDEKQTQAVIDAEKRNGRKIVVGHNMRFSPPHVRLKELMMSAPIGPIRSVDFHWYLDTSHGTDYFRRWHAIEEKSGSLWVHKATHHFDYMNWLLDAEPTQVQAYGDIKRFGKAGPFRHTNCRPCPHKTKCPFYWDMTKSASAMRLYGDVEHVDGYLRDACVFRPEVTTFDTMSASVTYDNGVMMSYSLNAYMPIEGYTMAFNGDLGRVEIRSYANQPWTVDTDMEVHVIKGFGGTRTKVDMPVGEGEHGGSDDVLRNLIFRRPQVPAHLALPDSRAGAMSCLTGIAARRSCHENRPITIADLVRF